MKRKIHFTILIFALLAIVFYLVNVNDKNRLNDLKLSELRISATSTSKLVKLGQNLERTEDSTGFYEIKGSKHYQWSVRDSYNLPDVSITRIKDIDKIMTAEGWKHQKGLRPTLEEDYSWAKQYNNSFDVEYLKTDSTRPDMPKVFILVESANNRQ